MNEPRPSSIGEILDRAISTYIRRWIPLFVIVALISVPVAIVDSFISPGITHLTDMLTKLAQVPRGHTAETQRILRDFQLGTKANGMLAVVYLLQFLLGPLAETALIIFAAALLDHAPTTIGAAYRHAIGRWFPQIVVSISYLFIVFVLTVVLVIAAILVGLAVAGVWALSHVTAIVLGVVAGIVAFAAFIFLAALGNVAWLMSTVSVATEAPNPFRAVGSGLRRTFDRTTFKRTIAIAFTILAITWFGSLVFTAFATAMAFAVHLDVVASLATAAGGIIISGVCLLLVLEYLRDIRLRREGADLLLLATGPSLPQA